MKIKSFMFALIFGILFWIFFIIYFKGSYIVTSNFYFLDFIGLEGILSFVLFLFILISCFEYYNSQFSFFTILRLFFLFRINRILLHMFEQIYLNLYVLNNDCVDFFISVFHIRVTRFWKFDELNIFFLDYINFLRLQFIDINEEGLLKEMYFFCDFLSQESVKHYIINNEVSKSFVQNNVDFLFLTELKSKLINISGLSISNYQFFCESIDEAKFGIIILSLSILLFIYIYFFNNNEVPLDFSQLSFKERVLLENKEIILKILAWSAEHQHDLNERRVFETDW